MMNRMDGGGEARLRYLDHEFEVVRPGSHVVCAVTGEPIPLEQLKYWSIQRQEPYRDAAASLEAEIAANPALRKHG